MPDDLWTKRDCAEWLKLSVATVERLMARTDDPIPYVKVGALVRFHPARVKGWVEAQAAHAKD